MRRAKLIVALTLATLLVVFTLQNVDVVEVRFLFWSLEMSRAIMLLGVLGTGIVLGWTFSELGTGRGKH